jgi:hypothetical protein
VSFVSPPVEDGVMSTGSTWRPIESFDGPAPRTNLVDAADAIVGITGASRFVSVDGGR